jgi:sensor histidine kinase regulating citrate/malate metabolism
MTQPPAHSAFSQDWWRVTLDSIADAVIATDRQGRVGFLNPAAQINSSRATRRRRRNP